jgi:transcriptional regulator with XRE-family HTH domain
VTDPATTEAHPFDGAALRRLRTERELTQGDLASQAGVTQEHISNIETGAKGPGAAVWYRIACALGVPMGDLARDAS